MSDLFGGLGGLMKGLSGFMPQDDPDVKLMTAQSELSALQQQETETYAQIGRQALTQGAGRFPELESKLRLIQENVSEAQKRLTCAQAEKDAKGTKFCQECGAKLGAAKCNRCGAPLSLGIRFCGECGAKQEE